MIKALIKSYAGGKYGRSGEYIALVQPEYFKNGKIKKTDFKVIKTLEIVKKGYHHQCANYSESIADVLVEFDDSVFLYKNVPHVCRWCAGPRLVGPQSLQAELEKNDFQDEAKWIDEEIYCYVDDDILYGDEYILERYIEENFD